MIMMMFRYEIDMTCPDNTTRGVYRGRDTECVVASLLPGRPYMFQVGKSYSTAGIVVGSLNYLLLYIIKCV